ncbi:4-hydroxythreonine-4-phosphate dehydrogenase PdxA [Halobacteriovorax sp.]|uniref:4-hydroxythreonine-4-phosphate dehydrogenase PdxA n=1 Tax=Halobacteriovorax sp. TaxID=2020862 RepID=UPI003562494A
MIYVTQGHELGIGIEVFLKSFSLLNSIQQKSFRLVANKDTVENNLKLLNFEYKIHNDKIYYNSNILNFIEANSTNLPQSTLSLNSALDRVTEKDILLTLPTSKDQLIDNNELRKGYTEFLRYRFSRQNLCMVFKAYEDATLLITDHIPLSKVAESIKAKQINEKVITTLNGFNKYFYPLTEVILSGINPHCGEGGLLGHEDHVINDALEALKHTIKVIGPVSGDTLHFYSNSGEKQLKVYMFHDQGLPVFKDKYRTIGLNITLGLPFLRMSVDHGTAFNIYGKGIADFSGCYYMLKEAIKVNRKLLDE